MNLKILLPFRVFCEESEVTRFVAETREGSFGFLPHRLDCVAALAPGILVYETRANATNYVAVDEGVLVKTGSSVFISVRNAIRGSDLNRLRLVVEQDFLKLDEQEKGNRFALAKLENNLLRRLVEFHHE